MGKTIAILGVGDISISHLTTGHLIAYVDFTLMVIIATSRSDLGKNIVLIPTKNSSFAADGSVHWNVLTATGGLTVSLADDTWGTLSIQGADDLSYTRFLVK